LPDDRAGGGRSYKADLAAERAPLPFPAGGLAVVIGCAGGLGAAFYAGLARDRGFARVIGFSRSSTFPLDLTDEATIAAAAAHATSLGLDLRLIVDATGFLHDEAFRPEKSWRELDPAHLARAFAVNAIGPALLMKHFLPLLPPRGKSVFATLSAKVGSIGDNRLGGWYGYRASKAALNQLVRTASIELRRRRPAAICAALHPGTVATALSAPFAAAGLDVQPPDAAAARLRDVIERLTGADSGGFFDYRGEALPW
jgi:NAD(P)-dependent dehydrogenase (short-subunit alcohol dehydrogenase family)